MGHRANLIVVRAGGYDLYYSHWAANTLPRDLFWGPAHALAFARAQRPADDWLDDVWAEGGAVIDPGARVLRLFGGEDLASDVPLRRLYLRLLAAVYVRQSTPQQLQNNQESTRRQYELAGRACRMGWPETAVRVIDVEPSARRAEPARADRPPHRTY